MRTSNSMRIFAGVAIAALLVAVQAQATIAYQNIAGNYGNQGPGSGPYVLGSQFTVGATPLSVTALGAFDNGQNGWAGPVSVAIYDFTSQTMVGSMATFSGTSGANLGTLGADGGSRFLPVTPFTLNAGTSYMIVAAGYGGSAGLEVNYNNYANLSNPYSTVGVGFTAGVNYFAQSGAMQFPTTQDMGGTPQFSQYAAGTFDFTPVPEVGHFAMAAVGLLGLVYIGRYARNRRTQKLA